MLTSATKHRIDACRDILVGKLPLPTDQVELITITLIYKFMDDLDEESVKLGGKRSFFTGELAKYRWRNLLPQTVSAAERMALFAEGIEVLGDAESRLMLEQGRFAELRARDSNLFGSLQRLAPPERETLIGYLQSQVPLKEFEPVVA